MATRSRFSKTALISKSFSRKSARRSVRCISKPSCGQKACSASAWRTLCLSARARACRCVCCWTRPAQRRDYARIQRRRGGEAARGDLREVRSPRCRDQAGGVAQAPAVASPGRQHVLLDQRNGSRGGACRPCTASIETSRGKNQQEPDGHLICRPLRTSRRLAENVSRSSPIAVAALSASAGRGPGL
jgi:hypothetical protein